ncbi:lytic transglycosylase domain-containing protein [Thermosulfurimonas marina]|uniref:Lytic transglycosylase domain-containing protein n=1 Tax=Thermosulfurimonas marina TaxID=2047767 RepID=A0A6H1WTH0_9BACT|nr:lytic transglycosylase domain-containing protein [Thermosulfurimonas marina]QJA06507.1 lytic transglycosylase domain-containing protein [Thermosulfurimonas marina]
MPQGLSRSLGLILILGGLGLWAAPARADIYRYVDPQGRVYFTNVPLGPGWKLYLRTPRPRPRRATPWEALFEEVARAEGLDAALLKAVARVESGFNPRAVSPKGALGLMQLMPETAKTLGVSQPFNPRENLRAAARFLKRLLLEFGDLRLALAAYHAGPEAVRRYQGLPPFPETRRYVTRVLQYYRLYRSR